MSLVQCHTTKKLFLFLVVCLFSYSINHSLPNSCNSIKTSSDRGAIFLQNPFKPFALFGILLKFSGKGSECFYNHRIMNSELKLILRICFAHEECCLFSSACCSIQINRTYLTVIILVFQSLTAAALNISFPFHVLQMFSEKYHMKSLHHLPTFQQSYVI